MTPSVILRATPLVCALGWAIGCASISDVNVSREEFGATVDPSLKFRGSASLQEGIPLGELPLAIQLISANTFAQRDSIAIRGIVCVGFSGETFPGVRVINAEIDRWDTSAHRRCYIRDLQVTYTDSLGNFALRMKLREDSILTAYFFSYYGRVYRLGLLKRMGTSSPL